MYNKKNIEKFWGKHICGFRPYNHKNLDEYYKNLSNVENFQLNRTNEFLDVSFWSICLEIKNYDIIKRDNLIKNLREYNIDSRPYFYPISDMPMYKTVNTKITHEIYQKGIYLPIFFDLKDEEIDYICEIIIKLAK